MLLLILSKKQSPPRNIRQRPIRCYILGGLAPYNKPTANQSRRGGRRCNLKPCIRRACSWRLGASSVALPIDIQRTKTCQGIFVCAKFAGISLAGSPEVQDRDFTGFRIGVSNALDVANMPPGPNVRNDFDEAKIQPFFHLSSKNRFARLAKQLIKKNVLQTAAVQSL